MAIIGCVRFGDDESTTKCENCPFGGCGKADDCIDYRMATDRILIFDIEKVIEYV